MVITSVNRWLCSTPCYPLAHVNWLRLRQATDIMYSADVMLPGIVLW